MIMMITQMPQQAPVAGRSFGGEFWLRFLQPLPVARLWRGMWQVARRHAAGQTKPRWTGREKAEFAPSGTTDSLLLREGQEAVRRVGKSGNAPLESLAGGALAARFHAWHGRSGRRYVCSVFPAKPAEPDFGLPDFGEAVVIAAAFKGDDTRGLVSICQCEAGAKPGARESFIAQALAAGAAEWHVHLLAAGMMQRRALLADIKAMTGAFAKARAAAAA
jgi:hypothetical protein